MSHGKTGIHKSTAAGFYKNISMTAQNQSILVPFKVAKFSTLINVKKIAFNLIFVVNQSSIQNLKYLRCLIREYLTTNKYLVRK